MLQYLTRNNVIYETKSLLLNSSNIILNDKKVKPMKSSNYRIRPPESIKGINCLDGRSKLGISVKISMIVMNDIDTSFLWTNPIFIETRFDYYYADLI